MRKKIEELEINKKALSLVLGFQLGLIVILRMLITLNADQINRQQTLDETRILKYEVPFIENIGQLDNEVSYFTNVYNGSVYITEESDLVYSFNSKINEKQYSNFIFSEEFVNRNKNNFEGKDKSIAKINDFRSKEVSQRFSNIPSFYSLSYKDIYEGIDLKLSASNKNIEKIFTIKSGYDPSAIQLHVEGAEGLSALEDGRLLISSGDASVALTKPIAYQTINGKQNYVEINYKVNGSNYGFEVAEYNQNYPLIIDPLVASTFLGGSLTDLPYGPFIEVDDEGFVYISGFFSSQNFPRTTGVFQSNYSGGPQDCFIAKFNNDLSELIASTFLGGSGFETECTIELDNYGNVYVGGYTNSKNFPTSENAYSRTNSGNYDIFISKLSNDLSTLLASTYIGGSKNDGWESNRIDLEIGHDGNLYVAAQSSSEDFPTTDNAYDTSFNGTGVYIYSGDIVAFKFDPNLENLLSSTYLGGEIDEFRVSLALDNNDNVFIVTSTYSYNIPTLNSAYDKSYNGAAELYIYKLDSDLSTRLNSTYFGGANDEVPHAAETDSEGNLYITGYTSSPNFNATTGSFDNSFGGVEDGFIIKLDANLNSLLASTFIGGNKSDRGQAIKIKNDKIYITGRTLSPDFPIVEGTYDDEFSGGTEHGDISVSALDLDLTTMYASTFLGGPDDEKPLGLAIDNSGNVFIGGFSHSGGYPTTEGAYDETFDGVIDVIVAKFNFDEVQAVKNSNDKPVGFILYQNYPNPFNPSTTINYNLEVHGYVDITIYDELGQSVIKLFEDYQSAGEHQLEWNGKNGKGESMPSGVYFCKVVFNNLSKTIKLSLLR